MVHWWIWSSRIPENPYRFTKNHNFIFILFLAKSGYKDISYKKFMHTKNLPLDKLHVLCFMKKIVSPTLKTWHSKNHRFLPFLNFFQKNAQKLFAQKFMSSKELCLVGPHILCFINFLYRYGIKLKTRGKCQFQTLF